LIYLFAASLFVLSTLVILFIRPQPLEAAAPDEKQNGAWLNPRYLAYLGIVFLAVFAMTLPQPLSPNFLQNQHGLSLGQIGQLGSIAYPGIVLLNLGLGFIEARAGFLISQLAVAVFAFCLWRGSGMAAFAIGFFLLGGSRTARSFATAQTRNLVHSARMGLAYGITETVNAAAVILASPLAGYLYGREPLSVYTFSLGLILVSILVGLIFNPARGNYTWQGSERTAISREASGEV
jgi:hypothetical protein